MRHRVYGKHLNRDKNQRTALFRGLVRSLILHESINTTLAKAKAVRGLVDSLIVRSKQNSQAARNLVNAFLPQKEVRNKLFEEIAPRYQNRTSGFTSIIKLGTRAGDGAMIVKMSLVGEDESKKETRVEVKSSEEKPKEKQMRKTKNKKEKRPSP